MEEKKLTRIAHQFAGFALSDLLLPHSFCKQKVISILMNHASSYFNEQGLHLQPGANPKIAVKFYSATSSLVRF
jgi:hypothetical protein